jgi:ABC-type sulfate transport system permease subunit
MNIMSLLASIPYAAILLPIFYHYNWLWKKNPLKADYGRAMAINILIVQIALTIVQFGFSIAWLLIKFQ